MPKATVVNHGLTVATRGTSHIAMFDVYDYCWTIAGKLEPFPNWVPSTLLAKGKTETVLIDGEPVWTAIGEVGPASFPAHIGKNGGDHSTTYRFEATPTSWSQDVVAEGNGVVRRTDTTRQNHRNTTGNVIEKPDSMGLTDPERIKEFCQQWAALKKAWPYLNEKQRRAAIKMIANGQLEKAGIPGLSDVRGGDLGGALGNFDDDTWSIGINDKSLVDSISDDDFAELGATVFHELRHAEQHWYLARFLAGAATDLDPLQAAYFVSTTGDVPPWVAFLAMQYPLPADADDWRTVLGADVYNSIFGDGRAARDLLYQEWNPIRKELLAALAKNGNDWFDPAIQPLVQKDAPYMQKYTELAEEKDAREAEEKFKKQCSH